MNLSLLLALVLAAVDRPVIDLSGGKVQPLPLAIARPLGAADAGAQVETALGQDFDRSGLFRLLDPRSFLAPPAEGIDAVEYGQWQSIGAQALVKMSCDAGASLNDVKCDMRLYDVARSQEVLHGTYNAPRQALRMIAHRFGDDVVKYFTREPSIFQTRIAWVRESEVGKQIVTSDWDGFNPQPLTGAGINLLPSWTPDGKSVLFTSFRENTGGHLFSVDVATVKIQPLVLTGDFATGGVVSADGSRLAFSSSLNDNSDIYVARADGSGPKRVTDARGIDISASWSPDGKRLAFVSERAGTPQIYTMAADGSDVRRITFQGNYNQEPAWSPKGDLIAFSGRDEHRVFDLYTVSIETGKVTRLTQNQGTNEKPAWAPNGRYVLFSSTRTGKRQIWMCQADGGNHRQVTNEKVGASDPAWSPLPR